MKARALEPAVAVACCAIGGALIAALDLAALAGVVAAAVLVSAAWFVVRRLGRRPAVARRFGGESDDGLYRLARRLFYLALLTSTWLQLRVHGLTLSDAMFAAALIVALATYIVTRQPPITRPPTAMWVGLSMYVTGAFFSTVISAHNTLQGMDVIARVLFIFIPWMWLAATVLRTHRHVWIALEVWVVSAAVCGFWALGQHLVHLPGVIDSGRSAGLADHVNDLGALSACAIVPALALSYRHRKWFIAFAGVAFGLILSGSVGSMAAAFVALTVGLALRELIRPALVVIAAGALIILLAGSALGPTPFARFSTTVDPSAPYQRDTAVTRVRSYEIAWQRIATDPLFGVGVGQANDMVTVAGSPAEIHNLLIGAWFETGVFGFVGIMTILLSIGRAGWKLAVLSVDPYLATVLFAAYVAYLGVEMSEPALYKRYSLVPALLIVSLVRRVRSPSTTSASHRHETGAPSALATA